MVDADVLARPLFNVSVDEVPSLLLTALLPFAPMVLLETMAVDELAEADEEAVNIAELVDPVLLEAEELTAPGLLREPDGLAPAELSYLVELTEDS